MFELFLAGSIIIILLVGIVAIGLYILLAFSLYTMANNKGLDNAWLAFIPVLQLFTIGRLIGTLKFQTYTVPFPAEWVLLGTSLATIILDNGFINLIAYLICILAYYNIYLLYSQDKAVVY